MERDSLARTLDQERRQTASAEALATERAAQLDKAEARAQATEAAAQEQEAGALFRSPLGGRGSPTDAVLNELRL